MNRIGPYQILKLSQLPTVAGGQWNRITRAGVNGQALWHTGQRAELLELESHHPCLTLAVAENTYRSYLSLTGPAVQPIRILFARDLQQANRAYNADTLYKVLAVTPVPGQVRALLRGHFAGEAANYQAWLCCRWVLQPITR